MTADTLLRVTEAAHRLRAASATRTPCAPVRDLIGATDVEAAYAVQQQLTQARLAAGARVVGRKIGLTSPAVQQQLGVDQPDFGVLFDDMQVAERRARSDGAGCSSPRSRRRSPSCSAPTSTARSSPTRSARRSTTRWWRSRSSTAASSGWDITFADTVADNASSGLFVLGAQLRRWRTSSPRDRE